MTFSEVKIQKALKAENSISDLNAKEQEIYFERFAALMWRISETPTSEEKRAFNDYIAKH